MDLPEDLGIKVSFQWSNHGTWFHPKNVSLKFSMKHGVRSLQVYVGFGNQFRFDRIAVMSGPFRIKTLTAPETILGPSDTFTITFPINMMVPFGGKTSSVERDILSRESQKDTTI